MKIGSLYEIKKYRWRLFSSKEKAAENKRHSPDFGRSFSLGDETLDKKKYIVLFEEDGDIKKVLTADGRIGYTWFESCYNDCFEEVKHP